MKRITALLLAFTLLSLLLTSCSKDTIKLNQEPDNAYGVGLEIEVEKQCRIKEIIEIKVTVKNNAPEIKTCAVRANSRHFITGFIDGYAKINEDSEYVHADLGEGFTTTLYVYMASRPPEGTKGEIKIYTVGEPKADGADITTAIYLPYEFRDGVIVFGE